LNRIIHIFLVLIAALLTALPLAAEPDLKEQTGEELFARYQMALLGQKDALKSVDMEVLMEGDIPKLKKQGKMSALKNISSLGRVSWKLLGFWGDDTVKKEVMARYMQLEQESASGENDKKKNDISITPDNYNFKYKGLSDRGNRTVHVFELKPKHKRVGLFKGELWLDPETCLPVREVGRLVKNPSIFIKRMEFVRDYEIRDGVAYLKRMESHTDTRIVGRANLNIEYANVRKQDPLAETAVEEARGALLR
jgi:hypothetical protein